MNDEQQRILCQKFEEALLEYDSDDVGDLDDECEEIVGSRPLEGDAQLEAALDEFLTEKEDEILIEGTKHLNQKKRTGGSGYSALVGKAMVHASQLSGDDDPAKTLLINIEESKKQMQKDLADADAILANPEMDLPPEEIFIDGKSYFSETPRNPWDCESILSTYSNLDNNPVVIGRTSRKSKKKGKKKELMEVESQVIPEDKPVKIHLSNKTGLPLGVFDKPTHNSRSSPEEDCYGESDTYISVNKGEARNKTESTLEKKVRKMTVKEERKICRIQKKIMKEAFREEFQKRGTAEVVDAVGGTTVFRFS
jgi:protein LTV1